MLVIINIMSKKQNYLDILRSIDKKPTLTQRKMASKLGFSLGKLSYCLKSLQQKGLIKMNNFKRSETKIRYIYKLTPSGISEKTKLTINFMKRKMKEYEELKKELKDRSTNNLDK
jgi:EPS-associated MarR family transcriptional regulator